MFTTICRYSVKPGQMQATIERVRAGLVPIISKQQGFISYHALDAGDNAAICTDILEFRARVLVISPGTGGDEIAALRPNTALSA